MGGGVTARQQACRAGAARGRAVSAERRGWERMRGLAHAAAWHVRMKSHFDRLFGFAPCDCPAHAGRGAER